MLHVTHGTYHVICKSCDQHCWTPSLEIATVSPFGRNLVLSQVSLSFAWAISEINQVDLTTSNDFRSRKTPGNAVGVSRHVA